MSTTDDWGFWLGLAAVVYGGYLLYDKYIADDEVEAATPVEVPRPTGMIYISEASKGTKWWLDADSTKGPRTARIGWLTLDHAGDKTNQYRETKMLWLANCDAGAYQELSAISYSPNGDPSFKFDTTPEKADVRHAVPGSMAGGAFDEMCAKGFDTPK